MRLAGNEGRTGPLKLQKCCLFVPLWSCLLLLIEAQVYALLTLWNVQDFHRVRQAAEAITRCPPEKNWIPKFHTQVAAKFTIRLERKRV